MKKLFTLCFSLLAMGVAAHAQGGGDALDETFQFVDLDGNVVPDGSVITVAELNEEGQMVIPLRLKNATDANAAAGLYEEIDNLPNGTWQTCPLGNCVILSESGYSPKSKVEGNTVVELATEWLPEEGQYARWTATMQIRQFNITTRELFGTKIETVGDEVIGYGPKVTINFVYDNPAGIGAARTADATARQTYNLNGQRTANGRKGLSIVRLANGKTIKKLN